MRSRSPHLVNSTDLVQASDRIGFRQLLPILVRRLILATNEGVTSIVMRGDEGIAAHGFDGTVSSTTANAFVPFGDTVWEMGTDKVPGRKAQSDYAARIGTKSPLKSKERKSTIFVFVTPRRWPGKNTWVSQKKKLRHWRDVIAIDADDLHSWLEQAPAVHYWISQEFGKVTEGVRAIDAFFEEWSAATNPPITPKLLSTGPKALMEDVQNWIRSGKATKEISFLSRENGLAMIAAAFALLPDNEKEAILGRTLVVTSPTAWNELRQQDAQLILIPSFPGLTAEMLHVRPGIRWIRPKGRDEDPQAKEQYAWEGSGDMFRDALVGLGVPEEEARQLVPVAKRSFTAFRRRLAVHPSLLRPRWAMPEVGRKLLAPLLVGKWIDGRPEDLNIVTGLAECSWKTLADVLIPWAMQEDPPWVSVASGWYPVDRGDVWNLLAPYLTESDLDAFSKVAVDVLSRVHPKWLSDEAFFVSTQENRKTSLSDELVRGVASILACMGSEDELRPLSFTRFPEWAGRILHDWFLDGAKDWRVWAYLSEQWILPLLAEADPVLFLRELGTILKEDEERLKPLFRSRGAGSFATPPLAGLLAALKMLSIWPEYLDAVTSTLLQLSTWPLDKKNGETPQGALLDIYRSWYPITKASVVDQVTALRNGAKTYADIVAELLLSLLPNLHDTAIDPPQPKWRKGASRSGLTGEEQNAAFYAFLDLYMELCTKEPQRILRLVSTVGVPRYWKDKDTKVMEFLRHQELQYWTPGEREELRMLIIKLLSHNLQDAQQEPEEWAELRDIAERCAPTDVVEKWKWLFVKNPPVRSRGMERLKTVQSERTKALEVIWTVHAWNGIERILQVAEEPGALGFSLAELTEASEHAWEYLLRTKFLEDNALRSLFRGLVVGSLEHYGDKADAWAEAARKRLATRKSKECAEFELMLKYDADKIRALDPEVRRFYWEGFGFWGLRGVFHWEVVEGLLSVGRFYSAIEALASYREEIPADKLMELSVQALTKLLVTEPSDVEDGDLRFEIAHLVDGFRANADFPEELLVRLDLRYIRMYEWAPLNLFKELGRSPQLFIQAVQVAFLPRNGERKELSEAERNAADVGYEVLSKWAGAPGWQMDGSIDVDAGYRWIEEMEVAFEDEPGWLDIAYRWIGEAMGRYTEGRRPSAEICELIERIGKADLDEGVELGLVKSRGARFGSDGASERSDASKYAELAAELGECPRVSAIYRRMTAQYERMAQRRDDEDEARKAGYGG